METSRYFHNLGVDTLLFPEFIEIKKLNYIVAQKC